MEKLWEEKKGCGKNRGNLRRKLKVSQHYDWLEPELLLCMAKLIPFLSSTSQAVYMLFNLVNEWESSERGFVEIFDSIAVVKYMTVLRLGILVPPSYF